MQRLANCDITIDIEVIEDISGSNQYFEIFFSTPKKERYKLIFDGVWDMRYSIEATAVDRFCEFRECLPTGLIDNNVYIVENSEYIKYFERQVAGLLPVDELTHYIVDDRTDTILDILTDRHKPVLIPL